MPIAEWDDNDMPRYPKGYHHFNCETTKLLKQPDVVMLMYLLPDEFSAETKRANFEYYEARTLHKSSLSPSIHAIIGIEVGDTTRAVQYFERSALVDLADNQGNTAEGMHIASAGGTWQILVNGFGGLRILGGRITLTPGCRPTGRASGSACAGAAGRSGLRSTTPMSSCCSAVDQAGPRRCWSAARS